MNKEQFVEFFVQIILPIVMVLTVSILLLVFVNLKRLP
jgi:hypothetical protein